MVHRTLGGGSLGRRWRRSGLGLCHGLRRGFRQRDRCGRRHESDLLQTRIMKSREHRLDLRIGDFIARPDHERLVRCGLGDLRQLRFQVGKIERRARQIDFSIHPDAHRDRLGRCGRSRWRWGRAGHDRRRRGRRRLHGGRGGQRRDDGRRDRAGAAGLGRALATFTGSFASWQRAITFFN